MSLKKMYEVFTKLSPGFAPTIEANALEVLSYAGQYLYPTFVLLQLGLNCRPWHN